MHSKNKIAYSDLLHLTNNTQTFATILKPDGTLIYANNAPLKASNLTQKDVAGKKFWDCLWWAYDKQVQALIKDDCTIASAGDSTYREVQFQSIDGLHWIEFNAIPVRDDSGVVINVVVEGRSIEARKQAERELQISQEGYKSFFDDLDEAFLLSDENCFIQCNIAAVRLLGFTKKDELLVSSPSALSPVNQPDGRESIKAINEMYAVALDKGSHRFEWTFLKDDSSPIVVEVLLTVVVFGGKQLMHWSWFNLTKIKLQQKELQQSELKYKALFESSSDANLLTEGDQIVDCNEAAVRMIGYGSKEALLSEGLFSISPEFQSNGVKTTDYAEEMLGILFEKGNNRFEWDLRHKNGEVFPVEVALTRIPYGDKELVHAVWRDLTEVKKQQQQLRHLAHYDSLTNLPNRVLFADRFNLAIAHSKRAKTLLAVCFIDLDDFKSINDKFGHDIGDKLLIQVAQRIRDNIREEDTVSRQGGDEFTLLLGGIETAQQCEHLVGRMLVSLAKPYEIGERTHKITASCGITLYPSDDADIDTLVKHADHAMYQAKVNGKNTYAFFDTATERSSQEHTAFLNRVLKAIKGDELVLHYQPKINMRTGEMFGAEALVRWQHPEDGLISPFGFLPQIENTLVMIHIGHWVLENALMQLGKWCEEGKRYVVSINIDAHHFMNASFFDELRQALARHPDVPAELLEIEIIESVAFNDLVVVSNLIRDCQTLGVSFALDDFGTGYSSLAYLKGLPVQWLKIDQTFVHDMLVDKEDLALIEGIVSLAKAFKRSVIAEGVETIEHGEVLIKLGCEYAQGYGIAKPMPASEVMSWELTYQANKSWTRHSKISLIEDKA